MISSAVKKKPKALIWSRSELNDSVLVLVTNRQDKPPALIRSIASAAPWMAREPT
jgi:hypothetical protein